MTSRPELVAGRAEIVRAEADVEVMRDMFRPMALVRTGPSYTMAEGRGWMAMFGISLPIWRDKLHAGVAEAQAMRAMSEADLRAMTRMIEGDAAVAVSQLQASRDRQAALTTDVLPRARMAIEPAVAGYTAGQLPLVSVIEAVQALWLVQISLRRIQNSVSHGRVSDAPLDRMRRSSNDILSTLRRIGAPLASAAATAILFTGALWMQHARSAWPFAPQRDAVAPLSGSAMPSAAATTASTHDRVAVDVNAATVQELGIRLEVVGRQSLTQEARAVATIVPDESRISHVHTRVAGWVEQLDVNTTGELVTAGQPLARIFSQELLSSQAEIPGRATEHRRVRYLERGDRQWANAPHRARDGTGRNRRHRAERRTETAGDRRCPEERRS